MKRFLVLTALLCAATFASAQKADVAFVAGGSFVSDTQSTFPPLPSPGSPTATLKTDHHYFLEGALGVRLFDAKLASLHAELPIAGIPSQNLTVNSTFSTVVDHLSTVFITPGVRLKLLPIAHISPWVSVGGGWARYSIASGTSTSKAALQYGGGLDFKTGLPLLGFRAEVRDFVTGNTTFGVIPGTTASGLHHHNVLAGGGIVLRF